MTNDTFFVDLVEQHRDAHQVLADAIRDFSHNNWDKVGSSYTKPTWAPVLWLAGWDVEDTPGGPIIHAAFISDQDDPSVLSFPACWLDKYNDLPYYTANEEIVLTDLASGDNSDGRKYGHLTVVK